MASKTTTYQIITDRVIELLERGVIPWKMPWSTRNDSAPRNLVSGKQYRGLNLLVLNSLGFQTPYFVTFNQAQAKGGTIRKGERGFPVVFWKFLEHVDKETGEKSQVPFLRYYTVFNLTQTEGIELPTPAAPQPENVFEPIEAAQTIVSGMPDAPPVRHGQGRAFYRPAMDFVGMPSPEEFTTPEEYYSTLFHELVHATGHERRCNRKGITGVINFGSEIYAQEELVAEMGAAFLCGESGLTPAVIENQAAYIQGWLTKLKNDPKCLVQAAGQAQKAADFILKVPREVPAE